jgi:CBS domain-containing protein
MKAKAESVMTKDPACCTPQTSLREVGQMMVAHDCGSIPVIETKETMKLVGIITDRDIVCRSVAQNKNPLDLTAGDCMSNPVVTAEPDTSLEECCALMEENQVRRIPIVDEKGSCCGVVTQAHIARHAKARDVAQVLKDVSQKTDDSSRVMAGAR